MNLIFCSLNVAHHYKFVIDRYLNFSVKAWGYKKGFYSLGMRDSYCLLLIFDRSQNVPETILKHFNG